MEARLGSFEGCLPDPGPRAGPEPAEFVPSKIVTSATKTVTYFDSTFDEAMVLTREARDYLAYQENADLESLSPVGRMAASPCA